MIGKSIEEKRNIRLIEAFTGTTFTLYGSYITRKVLTAFRGTVLGEDETEGTVFEHIVFAHLETMEKRGEFAKHPKIGLVFAQWKKAKTQLEELARMDEQGKTTHEKVAYVVKSGPSL